jgi:DNA-directed RNA polymerase specialized sigma24 family protein
LTSEAAPPSLSATELCERYAARVFQFATMVASTDLEAEDLAQSALERVVRGLPSFDPSKARSRLGSGASSSM